MFLEEGEGEFLEPAGGDGVQFEDVAVAVQKLHHAFGADFLGKEAEADFDLLDGVKFEGEAKSGHDVDGITLRERSFNGTRGIAHFVGVTLGVEGFGPDPGHAGICLGKHGIGSPLLRIRKDFNCSSFSIPLDAG